MSFSSVRTSMYDFTEAKSIICPACSNEFDRISFEKHKLTCSEYKQVELVDCQLCKRKFLPINIEVHKIACQKLMQSKRKPFNMKDIRCRFINEKLKVSPDVFNKWGGGFKVTSSFSCAEVDRKPKPSHITCDYCGRKFNYDCGVRHIKICEENARKKAVNIKRPVINTSNPTKVLASKQIESLKPPSAMIKEKSVASPLANIKPNPLRRESSIKSSTIAVNKPSVLTRPVLASSSAIKKPVEATKQQSSSLKLPKTIITATRIK